MTFPAERSVATSLGPHDVLRISDWTLEAVLGEGGMGIVWAARDCVTGAPVALKVLTSAWARGLEQRHKVDQEVGLTASLCHPAIVSVLDAGRIETPVVTGEVELYPAGLPFIVMERVEGSDLRRWCGKLAWEQQRWILLQLLGALAHVHARGVVHLDLKPANVLVGPSLMTVKLADFGLAMRYEQQEPGVGVAVHAGTPAYMAPEQVEGRSRDYGPWTDLYALGALAYSLAAGYPPFRGGALEVAQAHLHAVPPSLPAHAAVPPGFEDWVRTLLHKHPQDRFQLAADAALALEALGSPSFSVSGAEDGNNNASDMDCATDWEATVTTASPKSGVVRRCTPADTVYDLQAERGAVGRSDRPHAIAIASTWRRPHGEADAPFCGPGVIAMRTIEVAGRDEEQGSLWQALRRVASGRTQEIVVLKGPIGSGKTRLADWLCERASELGAATAVRAVHGCTPAPRDGLLPAIARRKRRAGDSTPQLWQSIRDDLRSDAQRAGVRPAPVVQQDNEPVTSAEKHDLMAAWLANRGAERPLILWIDDVQWGRECLEVCQRALDTGAWRGKPVLIVLGFRTEGATCPVEETGMLEALSTLVPTTVIDLGPVRPDARRVPVDAVVRPCQRQQHSAKPGPRATPCVASGWLKTA